MVLKWNSKVNLRTAQVNNYILIGTNMKITKKGFQMLAVAKITYKFTFISLFI